MNDDLSLSQSLGGLRIANPDDDSIAPSLDSSTNSSAWPPPLSPQSSASTVTSPLNPPLLPGLPHEQREHERGLDFDPDNFDLHNTNRLPSRDPLPLSSASSPAELPHSRLSHRQSIPLNPQALAAMQYPGLSSIPNSQTESPSSRSPYPRPISGLHASQSNSPSSNMSGQNSYRYRDDIAVTDGSLGGMTRTESRSARGPASAVPGRESSRTYKQTASQMIGNNGPLPPRRNSKRARAPTGGSGSTPTHDGSETYLGSSSVPRTAEEWRERGAAVATQRETDSSGITHTRTVKKGVKDFNFGRTLGEGSYSTVLAATDRQNLKEYAIKVLDKRHIIKEKKVKYVNIERDTLNRLTEHPGIVRLYYTFQDERSLYFVLDLATGGELLGVLKKMGSFDLECSRFYGAEILDSVAYMHSRGVIHRDLKPENVLLDRDMHVKITDFGTAKILPDPRPNGIARTFEPSGDPTDGAELDRAVSFVGTAEYVSPELLRDKNACKASDLWAFGCIIYQLLAGRPPFKAANEYLTFQKIIHLDYTFPEGFPEVARDLVERLLVLEPANRLPVEHIRNHQFFDGIQWGKGLWRMKAPRLKAYVPPPAEPIRLNGGPSNGMSNSNGAAPPPNISGHTPSQTRRPQLQSVTDLPPPSQLDIDWSPVLTHNNERILKLGNLIVSATSTPPSLNGKGGDAAAPAEKSKFPRFFSGNSTKKRERLVLITSSARLVIAAAGGNEKKAKTELNLLAPDLTYKSSVDAKGLTFWTIETVSIPVPVQPVRTEAYENQRDKHLSFEDPRATTSDPNGSKFSSQEWLDAVSQAREIALAMSISNGYSDDSMFNDLNASGVSSPADSLGGDAAMPMSGPSTGERHHVMRHTLRRNTDEDNGKSRKRFSKRHSKSGLAAVF